MIKAILIALLVIFGGFGFTKTYAEHYSPPAREKELQTIAYDLLTWLGQNSKYVWHGEDLPYIVVLPPLVIQSIARGEYIAERDHDIHGPGIIGAYDPGANVIYLRSDLNELGVRYVMIHELVHYMQFVVGEDKTAPCPQAIELPAYKLQHKWYKENVNPEAEPNILWWLMASLCKTNESL